MSFCTDKFAGLVDVSDAPRTASDADADADAQAEAEAEAEEEEEEEDEEDVMPRNRQSDDDVMVDSDSTCCWPPFSAPCAWSCCRSCAASFSSLSTC